MSKKTNSKSNIVSAFWQKMLLDANVIILAKKFRKEFDIPTNGFKSFQEFEDWRLITKQKYGDDQVRIDNFNRFEEEVKGVYSHRGIITDIHFRSMLVEFYYLNKVDDERLEELKYSGFGVEIFDDSVYIKIGSCSPIVQIKKYIRDNSSLIRNAQELFRSKEKIPPSKKFKTHSNFRRDDTITCLNSFSSKKLRGFGINTLSPYKEELISDLMKKLGFKGVNGNIVKTVLQRRRKMTKALSL